jgi:outer membrane receptor protein involved in Fe transport
MYDFFRFVLGGLGFALSLLFVLAAEAQEDDNPWAGIEEMVVLSAGSLGAQDFADADSVIAFDSKDLAAIGAQDISDIADFTPNLEIVTSGSTTPTFFIRGIGLNDFNSNSTGAVAIYQDGVAINAPAMQLGTLFDIESVNVLRGPQGTGLNRNASAGSIKIYSKKPTGETSGFLRADFGDYDYMDYEGAVEAPIYGDIIAGRAAFRFSRRDGFMKNRCAGAPPIADRVPFPGPPAEPGEQPWSICGESEIFNSQLISDIPVGLEKYVNDLNNWAARATFKIEPDLDIETTWLLNFHGGRRDEFSPLGQSYGTGGTFCRDGDICQAPFFGVPPEERGTASSGLLGGPQGRTGSGYQPREVIERLAELAPCTAETNPINGRRNTCRTFQPGETRADVLADRALENQAKITVARELAEKLDDKPFEGDFNRTGKTTNTVLGGFLSGVIDLPDDVQTTMTTGFDTYDRQIDSDVDFSPETLFHIKTTDDGWQLYQDIEFTGELDSFESPVRWELSGFFLREILNVEVANDLGDDSALGVGSREYRQKGWSGGASLQLSFDFWDDFTLDGGVRYNYDRKSLDYNLIFGGGGTVGGEATNLDEVWHAPTGTIRLTYNFREDTHAYWKYTRGWKPGTYNATSGQGRPVSVADEENLDSFEFGISGSWFEDRFQLNGALFYYAYEDYQIFTTENQPGGNTVFVTLNANDAEVYGAEIDATVRPWEFSMTGLRFAWLESQFLDFTQTNTSLAPSGIFVQEVQNSGNPLLNSPRFKVVLFAEQILPLGSAGSLTARWDGVWTDDTFFDASEGKGNPNILGERFLPDNTIGQEAYWLHNLRLTWRSLDGFISVAGWIRNLTDKTYKTFAFDASAFQKTTVYFVGDPRTYGTSIMVTF